MGFPAKKKKKYILTIFTALNADADISPGKVCVWEREGEHICLCMTLCYTGEDGDEEH